MNLYAATVLGTTCQWTAFVLLVYLDNSLNIQALLVCPAMSVPASLSVIVLSCNFSQPLLRPVIMRDGLACGHRVSPHGRTVSFVSWRWHHEQRGRLVRSTTSVFLTKSCQRIPRIIRWQHMWKASSFRRSSCRSVYVFEPYNKIDSWPPYILPHRATEQKLAG